MKIFNMFGRENRRYQRYGAVGRIVTFLIVLAVAALGIVLEHLAFGWFSDNFLLGLVGCVLAFAFILCGVWFSIAYAIIAIKSCLWGAVNSAITKKQIENDANNAGELTEQQQARTEKWQAEVDKHKKLKWLDILLAILYICVAAATAVLAIYFLIDALRVLVNQ